MSDPAPAPHAVTDAEEPKAKVRTAEDPSPQPLTRHIQQGLPTGQEPDQLQGQNGAIKPDGRG